MGVGAGRQLEVPTPSDTEPSEARNIQSYLSEAFPDILGPSEFQARALAPERTFWEKSMLLHEEAHRKGGKPRKPRMARDYYDLWAMIEKGVGEKALADTELFDETANHRQIYFNWTWMDYKTLRRESLVLLPREDQISEWRQDYASMQSEMFFGEAPDFQIILDAVSKFQQRVNESD